MLDIHSYKQIQTISQPLLSTSNWFDWALFRSSKDFHHTTFQAIIRLYRLRIRETLFDFLNCIARYWKSLRVRHSELTHFMSQLHLILQFTTSGDFETFKLHDFTCTWMKTNSWTETHCNWKICYPHSPISLHSILANFEVLMRKETRLTSRREMIQMK